MLSRQLKKEKEQETVSASIAETLTEEIARLRSRVGLIEEVLPALIVQPTPSGEESTLTLVDKLQERQPDYLGEIADLRDKLQERQPDYLGDIADLRDKLQERQPDPFEFMDTLRTLLSEQHQALADGLNGKAILKLDSAAENVLATDLNAAAATEFTKEFAVSLDSTDGRHQWWAAFTPVIATAESVADVDVAAPTAKYAADLPATPVFIGGNMILEVEFDTDAGSTKVYAAGDSVTITIQVAGDDLLPVLGYTVAQIVKRFDVV